MFIKLIGSLLLLVSSTALAFGGGSHRKETIIEIESGVDAIGVHVDGQIHNNDSSETTPIVNFSCPTNSSWSAATFSCVCAPGYTMQNGACVQAQDKCKKAAYTECQ